MPQHDGTAVPDDAGRHDLEREEIQAMGQRLRIGMIGCGEIAVRTAKGVAASEHGAHVMVMDVNEGVAADLGRTLGVPSTTRVEELLANPDVDAVYIAVPHHLHAPLTLQAFAAGKHVLVEKPIATTLEDAGTMIAAARRAGCVLSVAYDGQVNPEAQRLQALIANGAIGKVVGSRIVYRGDKPESYWHGGFTGRIQTDWRTSKAKAGGGVMIMNTIHDLNTMRFVTGLEVTRISCEYETYLTSVEVEDFIAATYRYDNGAIGTLEAGSAIRGKDPLGERNRIYGERGQIIFSNPARIFLTVATGEYEAGVWHNLIGGDEDKEQSRTRIVDGFAAAALAGGTPPVTGEDGWAGLAIALAAYQAGVEHRAVAVAAGN
ncbi:MAG: Gfo/Idh/MocA family protein [Thermomicrobiales bacterium]